MTTGGRMTILLDAFRRKGLTGGFAFLRNILMLRLGRAFPGTGLRFLPTAMDIEVSSVCNLRCPGCIHGHKDGHFIRPRPRFMEPQSFERILAEAGGALQCINMTPLGEAFLNPGIYEIIRRAKARGIYLTLDTNGHFMDAPQLAATGIDEITFALDGFSQGSYASYRRGGKLDTVLGNLESLSREVERTGGATRINVKFFMNRHTEAEAGAAQAFCQSLPGVRFFQSFFVIPPPDWGYYRADPYRTTAELHEAWAPVQDPAHDLYRRDEASGDYRQIVQDMPFQDSCQAIRTGIYVTTAGDAYPCCKAAALETEALYLGNVLQDGLGKVFNGNRARTIRKAYTARGGKHSICATCWVNRARGGRVRYLDPGLAENAGEH